MYPQAYGTYTEPRMRALFCCLALLWLLPQCGGATSTGGDAKSGQADADRPQRSGDDSNAKAEDDGSGSASAPAPEKSKGPSCDDGTCSLCGNGICPAGWYCDEKAGGGACSWLAECAEKPSCGCITRVLGASCKCREEGGGLKVSCD